MSSRTVRVTVRGKVYTYCPKYDLQTQSDDNEVEVSWTPKYGRHIDDLAAAIATDARLVVGSEVRVIVRQEIGHGVEAEAVA